MKQILSVVFAAILICGCNQSEVTTKVTTNETTEVVLGSEKAHDVDQPASYYLEISNNKNTRYSSNSREQTMQVLLNPGQRVSLGERTWQSSPWRYYQGIESNSTIELLLSKSLQLDINISIGKNNSTRFLNGRYQLREGDWIKLMGSGRITSNKIITTQNKNQLWLRLHLIESEANNQNP
jgi:hypothetical protein